MPYYTDLIWIKNVKRNNGTEWAYGNNEIRSNNQLSIHWPEHKSNPSSPNFGDLILLFQTYLGTSYFSHLGKFVDNSPVYAPENRVRYPWRREIEVLGLGAIPKERIQTAPPRLGGVSHGNACELAAMRHFREHRYDLRNFQAEIFRDFGIKE